RLHDSIIRISHGTARLFVLFIPSIGSPPATVYLLLAALVAVPACGPGGPRTHPVRGKVVVASADVKALAGGHVEAALEGDPAVRASGRSGRTAASGWSRTSPGRCTPGRSRAATGCGC
ncbi:MAG: hypothetical protein ACRC33_02480, partial [Gemmataceae bacterium]